MTAATAPPDGSPAPAVLTDEELAAAVAQASTEWAAAVPGSDLSTVSATIVDLPDLAVGAELDGAIEIDPTAAGWGWGAMDLLTVVRHELGHVLGREHAEDGLMEDSLEPGETHEVEVAAAPPAADATTESGSADAIESTSADAAAGDEAPTTTEPDAGDPADDPAPTTTEPTTTEPTTTEPTSDDANDPAPTTTEPASDDATPNDPESTTSESSATGTDPEPTTTDPSSSDSGSSESTDSASHWTVVDGVATASAAEGETLDHTIRYNEQTNSVELVAADGTVDALPLAGVTEVVVEGGAGDDTIAVDDSASSIPVPVAVDGGEGTDTVQGPAADTTWTVTGEGSGDVAGVTFAGAENLKGSTGNKDVFDVRAGGRVTSVDGGSDGFDTLKVTADTVISTPTGRNSGLISLDGTALRYDGLEPIEITGSNVVINGRDLGQAGNPALTLLTEPASKDVLRVGPCPNSDVNPFFSDPPCPGGNIFVQNFDGPLALTEIAELQYFVVTNPINVTINGGLGTDVVEFVGDYIVADGSTLTVNAETIKVNAGVTINVGPNGSITFNAITKDNGLSLVGITTTIPVLGATALIDISPDDGDWDTDDDYDAGDVVLFNGVQYRALADVDDTEPAPNSSANWELAGSANLIAGTISLNAFAGSLTATVVGGQTLGGGNTALIVDSVAGFANDGTFELVGVGTCTYTGRSVSIPGRVHSFTGVGGACLTSIADGATIRKDIVENGSDTGFRHAALDLEYHATVSVRGASAIAAVGNVTMTSTIDVTATASAAPGNLIGAWVSGTDYTKGDIVTDDDGLKYAATKDIVNSTTQPKNDTGLLGAWTKAEQKDSAVVAAFVLALAKSHLSGTGTIDTNGAVKLASDVKTNVTSTANAESSGSGAGIAVIVMITDSQAFIDSTAPTPVTAASLTLWADTDNTAPTTGTASPDGAEQNDGSANSPTKQATTKVSGNQSLGSGTLNVATTGGFIDAGSFTVDGGTGTCNYTGRSSTSFTGVTGCSGSVNDGAAVTGSSQQTQAAGGKADNQSKTSDGDQNLSAALAVIVLVSTTQAYISPTDATAIQIATSGGANHIRARSSNAMTATANAGEVNSSAGFGIAVAVTVGVVTTKAFLSKNVSVQANSLKLEATDKTGESTFKAEATSGAGGSSVGVAGSIAVNIVVSDTHTLIDGTDPVSVAGDLTLEATSALDNQAIAKAKQEADGGREWYRQASFALNVVNDRTTAKIVDGAQLEDVGTLTLRARSTDTMTTTAEGGAASSGTIVASAQVAISISNITTSASIGTGSALDISGGLEAEAIQNATVNTTAKGDTKGGNAGIGLSLALAAVDHLVDSVLARNLTANGLVRFQSFGSSNNTTIAIASAAGGREKNGNGDEADDGKGSVNDKADSNLGIGNSRSQDAGGDSSSSTSTPEAKSGENGGTTVTVAAAAAIALITAHSVAEILAGRIVNAGSGSVSLTSLQDTNSIVKAEGSATQADTANIGAAVAINLVDIINTAIVGTNASVTANGLSASAGMNASNGGDGKHKLSAEATAGAGGGKVGVAGSLALIIADVTTQAMVRSNPANGPPVAILTDDDLSLSATAVVESSAKALAKAEDTGTVGVGAGAAIHSLDVTTTASIANNATITGARNVTLTASSTVTQTSYAEAGTAGEEGSTLALTADAAITLADFDTSASIGTSSTTLSTTGTVTLSATQTAKTDTTAKADAVSGTVVIGLALALAVVKAEATATITRSVNAGGDVTLTAIGSTANLTNAVASATGAKGEGNTADDDTSGKDVNEKADDQLGNANQSRSTETGKTANTSDTSNAQAAGSDSNGQGGNTVTVAGAFAINIITTTSQASLGAGVSITATGKVALASSANTDATAKGDGKATEAGTVGVGAAVAVNKVDIVNLATTSNAVVSSVGLEVKATMRESGDDALKRWDGEHWVLVDTGEAFPEQPSDDDYFNLTKAVPGTSAIDGDQNLGTTLNLKNAADFGDKGTFTVTVAGATKECGYTGKSGNQLTGIGGAGCSGAVKDKAVVTVTTKTKVVSGTVPGTLTVESTDGFENAGKFTIGGIDGVCSYTGKTATTFTGVTGCTGTPKVAAEVKRIAKTPGLYQWDEGSSVWNMVSPSIGSGSTLPASPATNTFFRLAEHDIHAEASSGAGSDKVGIAGALALNIVSNQTRALVPAGSVTAGAGDVTLRAVNNEVDLAKASSKAKGATVGVGASLALNVLNGRATTRRDRGLCHLDRWRRPVDHRGVGPPGGDDR